MKIFIVQGECGEWSDHNEWTICAFVSEAKAEALVFELETLQKFNDNFCKREHVEFDAAYIASGANEIEPAPVRPEVPEGWRDLNQLCSHGKGTSKHKKSLNVLQRLHLANCEAYKKAHEAWYKLDYARADRMLAARRVWFQENYNPGPNLELASKYINGNDNGYRRFNTDRKYSFYETELIE